MHSSPNRLDVAMTQLGSPKGRPRLTQQRNAATSASVWEDKGTGVFLGLIVRAEDSGSRSDSQENDSRPLIVPKKTTPVPLSFVPLKPRPLLDLGEGKRVITE